MTTINALFSASKKGVSFSDKPEDLIKNYLAARKGVGMYLLCLANHIEESCRKAKIEIKGWKFGQTVTMFVTKFDTPLAKDLKKMSGEDLKRMRKDWSQYITVPMGGGSTPAQANKASRTKKAAAPRKYSEVKVDALALTEAEMHKLAQALMGKLGVKQIRAA